MHRTLTEGNDLVVLAFVVFLFLSLFAPRGRIRIVGVIVHEQAPILTEILAATRWDVRVLNGESPHMRRFYTTKIMNGKFQNLQFSLVVCC